MGDQKQGKQEPTKPEGEKTSQQNPDGEKTSNKSDESIHPNRYYHIKDKKDELEKENKELKKKLGMDVDGDDDDEGGKVKNQDELSDSKIDELVDKRVQQALEERELKSLDLPSELKDKAKKYAKLEGLSVREAVNSDYIQHLKEKHDKKKEIESASPSREGKKSSPGTSGFDPSKPIKRENYDFNDKEDIKRYKNDREKRKEWMKKNS